MRDFVFLSFVAVVSLSVAGGCSRGGDADKPGKPETVDKVAKVESPKPAAAARVKSVPAPEVPAMRKPVAAGPRPPQVRAPLPHKPKIRITALMKRGDAPPRVGIVQDSTGRWRILREGDRFLGYRVDRINYNQGSVDLDWHGQKVILSLKGMKVKKAQIRVAASDKKPVEAKLAFDDRKFRPTPDEVARGIDPNDAATWPEDYRGPVIERMAQSMPLDAVDSKPMPQIEPPQGTPEEIKQRFLEKYAPKSGGNPESPKTLRFPDR